MAPRIAATTAPLLALLLLLLVARSHGSEFVLDLSHVPQTLPGGPSITLIAPLNGSSITAGADMDFDVVFDVVGAPPDTIGSITLNDDVYDVPFRSDQARNLVAMKAMMPLAWHDLKVTFTLHGVEYSTLSTSFYLLDPAILHLEVQAPKNGFGLPLLLPNPGGAALGSGTAEAAEMAGHDQALYVVRLFSEEECDVMMADADATPFESDFHPTRPTWDHDGRYLKKASPIIAKSFVERLAPAVEATFGIPAYAQFPNEVFLVRYDMFTAQFIHSHADGSIITANVLLSDPADFTGGGTWFAEGNRLVSPTARGHAVIGRGWSVHAGLPITSGERYILVIFIAIQDFKRGIALQRESWYFRSQHPEWNVDIARGPEWDWDSKSAQSLRDALEYGPPGYEEKRAAFVGSGEGSGRWFGVARPIIAGGTQAGEEAALRAHQERQDPSKVWTLEELMGSAGHGHRWGSPPSDALMLELIGTTRIQQRLAILLPLENEQVSGFGPFVKTWVAWPANHVGRFHLFMDGIKLPDVDMTKMPAAFSEEDSSLSLTHRFLAFNLEAMSVGRHEFAMELVDPHGSSLQPRELVTRVFWKV